MNAISVENLSKSYRIGGRKPYVTFRESLTNGVLSILSRRKDHAPGELFWALSDVCFTVAPGEVVGIIGRNGAGKSTLLKLLSRITSPTEGAIEIQGRVGSLLEVGTGFHPELTGRENIHLNGAILGMRSAEVKRAFDGIVDFAEVDKFLDTPVKRYSSGMYMRLAFAVAAHLDPEILVVDEVLAVGDAKFQAKCLGKMAEVAGAGRTVLFVSHQLNAVRTLCSRAIHLAGGKVVDDGPAAKVIGEYLKVEQGAAPEWSAEHGLNPTLKNPHFLPSRFAIVDSESNVLTSSPSADDDIFVLIEGTLIRQHPALNVGFAIYAAGGELLFWAVSSDESEDLWPRFEIGANRFVARIPRHLLNEGSYRLELIVSLHQLHWISQPGVNAPAVSIEVRGGLSESPHWMEARPGLLAPVIRFKVA